MSNFDDLNAKETDKLNPSGTVAITVDNINNNNSTPNLINEDEARVNTFTRNEEFGQKSLDVFKSSQICIDLTVVIISLIWAILFLVYTGKDNDRLPGECYNLYNWDHAIMIYFFVIVGLNIALIIIYSCVEDPSFLIGFSFFYYAAMGVLSLSGLVLFIGINVSYFSLNDPARCGPNIYFINKFYIIFQWTLIGLGVCCCCCLCFFAVCLGSISSSNANNSNNNNNNNNSNSSRV